MWIYSVESWMLFVAKHKLKADIYSEDLCPVPTTK
jgi:hypothetical protein